MNFRGYCDSFCSSTFLIASHGFQGCPSRSCTDMFAGNAGSSGRAFPQLLELPQVVLTAYHSGLRTRKGEWSEWVTESYGQKTWKWWAQNNTEVMVLARLHGCQGIINSFSFTSLLSASLEELRVLASMLKRLGQHLFFWRLKTKSWNITSTVLRDLFWNIWMIQIIMISFTISNPMILWWLWTIPQFHKSLGNSYDETHQLWLNRNGPMMSFTISNRQ